MKIKHYKAPDMRTALRQVRDAQGPDAVILSSRRVAGGVEVVAAIDYDGEEVATEQFADSRGAAAYSAPAAQQSAQYNSVPSYNAAPTKERAQQPTHFAA